MAGRRHHTIPQFLLKGFESSRRRDEVYVWMYRRGMQGIEPNVMKVAVERDFYGAEDKSDLDDRITAMESEFAPLVEELRSNPSDGTAVERPDAARLVAHLAVRTRQFRQSVLTISDFMFESIRRFLNQPRVLQTMLVHELRSEGSARDLLRSHLIDSDLPPEQLDQAMDHIEPRLPEIVQQLLASSRPQSTAILEKYISDQQSVLAEAIRVGFLDSLSRNLNVEQRTANYERCNWFVVRTSSPLVLGDAVCLFETAGKRRFKPLDDLNDDVRRIYLPITSDKILVGTPLRDCSQIDTPLLNRATARCSLEFFVSSTELAAESPLVKDLGNWSGILNDGEVRRLMKQIQAEFLKRYKS